MEFLHLFCWRYFAGKPPVVSWNVDHFLRLYKSYPFYQSWTPQWTRVAPSLVIVFHEVKRLQIYSLEMLPWKQRHLSMTWGLPIDFHCPIKKAKPLPTVKRLHVSFKSIRLFYLKSGKPSCSTKLYSNKMPVVKSSVDKTLYFWYFKISVLILINQKFN